MINNNNDIENRAGNKPFLPEKMILWTMLLMLPLAIKAQNDITISDAVLGKAEITAPGSITFKPGFIAKAGCNVHAYIGLLQSAVTSSYTVPAETSASAGKTPATGSTDFNYIKSITYREAQTTEPTSSFKHLEEIQYFDGLGRPVQTVMVGASPLGKDIIQPRLYDGFGREAIIPLPYLDNASDGSFRNEVTEATVTNYYNTTPPTGRVADTRAYTQLGYDNSPLNRVVSQTGPGAKWADKPVTINYTSNTGAIKGWSVNNDGSFTGITYDANTLYVTEHTDEQGNISREYKDKQGQVVLNEAKLGENWLGTYYIYDDLGLLRCVVPPTASDPNTEGKLCYYYNYDYRNRMTEKKIPGAGTFTMFYDDRDRLRITQNSEQAAQKEYSFIKYDALNRPVETGIITSYSSGLTTLQDAVANNNLFESPTSDAGTFGYTNKTFPTDNIEIHTATYYDSYDFQSALSLGDSLKNVTYNTGDYNQESVTDYTPIGRVTGTMTRVLSPAGDASAISKNILYSSLYYDKYGHVLRSISDNHLGGKDIESNIYEDITYQVTSSRQEHYKGNEKIVIYKTFEYDNTGRLLATRQKLNDGAEITLSALTYNEPGELVSKYLYSKQTTGERSFEQKISYGHNIRGWLTGINDPSDLTSSNALFGMKLVYENTSEMGPLSSTGMYNGNIAGMIWNTKGDNIRGYGFSYDGLNRLLKASYAEGSGLGKNADYFNEEITGYDKNGNIQGLKRNYNNTTVDNLTYTYFEKSNQLQKIADAGTSVSGADDYPGNSNDYTYDTNGNMSFDGAKNLDIDYCRTLNLPQSVDFGGNNRLFYHYTATGAKVLKHSNAASGVQGFMHYINNIVYDGGSLSYILTDEGRILTSGEGSERTFVYEYNLKDHLGNNRVSFIGSDLGGAIDVTQSSGYYPFGMVMFQNNNVATTGFAKNKYLYNGKELQDDAFGGAKLNWYDYGARFYDGQIGRFTTVDDCAEKYVDFTPYQYAKNNSVLNIDINGDSVWIYDSNNQRMQFTAGMQYQGDDKFVAATITYLNEMNNVKQGNQVLSTLTSSSNNFDFKNIIPVDGNGNPRLDVFKLDIKGNSYKDGGGEIQAGNLMGNSMGNVQKVESLSHELYHGYEKEKGQNPATINGEVEAYLFGRGVSLNSKYGGGGTLGFGNGAQDGATYNQAMYNLMLGGFNQSDYNNALNSFIKGSSVNSGGNGIYKSHKVDPNYKPTILKFLPF